MSKSNIQGGDGTNAKPQVKSNGPASPGVRSVGPGIVGVKSTSSSKRVIGVSSGKKG